MTTSAATNPYASPKTSDLDSASDGDLSQPQLFSFNGRLGRLRFFTYLVLSTMSLMFFAGIGAAILIPLSPSAGIGVYGAFILCMTVYALSLYVRRLHDLNNSGWWTLLIFVPLLNLLLFIYLLFFPGSKSINSFGNKIVRNGTGVFVAFAVSLLLSFAYVGVIMAVALPAYQGYVERAQQAGQ